VKELFRAAFVIARRDFGATVLSKAFLLFLLGPLFPLLMGGIFGGVGSSIAQQAERPTIAVIMPQPDFTSLSSARDRIADAVSGPPLVRFHYVAPATDPAAQRDRLLADEEKPVLGVLDGTLDRPHITGAVNDGTLRQLHLLIDEARHARAAPAPTGADLQVSHVGRSPASDASARTTTALAGLMVLFLLTILLSGMLLSQLIEEKSNKVIEVLAAAVPIDAVFIGKLFAMLAMSLLGIAVWVTAGALAVGMLSHGGAALAAPAVGWPAFLALGFVYFSMSYLLLGAVFLSIGAHASTAREVQILSMPVTMAQVLVFAFAASAIGDPDGPRALAAAAFPLSSPFVMLARAAVQPSLLPHLLAIAWQMLWVATILHVGATIFRRRVLKSGPAPGWRGFRRA
jgi:ABC-2 type transport system permease protein